jgi:hypothetical protein
VAASQWPPLSLTEDGPTIAMLHLISQMVGKVPTALSPWLNHGWHLTLRVTPRGLRTAPIHGAGTPFELLIDLVEHELVLIDAAGGASTRLDADSIADFHAGFLKLLARCGHGVDIHPRPNEIDPAIAFADDRRPRTYDRTSAGRVLGALLQADRLFHQFRTGFLGKASPPHFFWGSFDLAVTRFSGRLAPRHPGGVPHLPDAVTREAYSHEVSSAGFWPGGEGVGGEPFFYAYAYPVPAGFAEAAVEPAAAQFDGKLGEFILPYESVRSAPDPDAAVMDFLNTTYRAAAGLGRWDRAALECAPGEAGRPRATG